MGFLLTPFLLFALVLARVAGMVMLAPIFGGQAVPIRIRAFFSVALALVITPIYASNPPPLRPDLIEITTFAALEVTVGLLIGLGVVLMLAGIQAAGQMIGQLSGLSLADVFDPSLGASVPVYSQLLYYMGVTLFVLLDGHRMVIDVMLETFLVMPPGRAMLSEDFLDALITILTLSFAVGVRAALPLVAALLLSTLVMGLVSRTMPQINILAVGFGLNALVVLGGLAVLLGGIAWAFQEETETVLALLQQSIAYRE